MGWDAFGLPAENAARAGVHPRDWTYANIARCAPAEDDGPVLDWSREFATCDPEYYGSSRSCSSTSYKAGLVYRKEAGSTGTRST
jgi:leucyl-tRNA synthetase